MDYFLLLYIWISTIALSQFIRSQVRNFQKSTIIRGVLFWSPFLFWSIVACFKYSDYLFEMDKLKLSISIFLLVILFLMYYVWNRQALRLLNNKDFLRCTPLFSRKRFYIDFSSLILSAIFEELFYRFFLFNAFISINTNYLLICIITSLLFTITHFITPERREYRINDYLKLFTFSMSWNLLYIYSWNILIPIIGHIFFNLPQIIYILKKRKIGLNIESED